LARAGTPAEPSGARFVRPDRLAVRPGQRPVRPGQHPVRQRARPALHPELASACREAVRRAAGVRLERRLSEHLRREVSAACPGAAAVSPAWFRQPEGLSSARLSEVSAACPDAAAVLAVWFRQPEAWSVRLSAEPWSWTERESWTG
jgi:hypothetical protein